MHRSTIITPTNTQYSLQSIPQLSPSLHRIPLHRLASMLLSPLKEVLQLLVRLQLLHRKHPLPFPLSHSKQAQSHVRLQHLRQTSPQPHLDPLHIHRQNPTLPRGHASSHTSHHPVQRLHQRRRLAKLLMCRSHRQHRQQHRRWMTNRCDSTPQRRVASSPQQKAAASLYTQRCQRVLFPAIVLQHYDTHVHQTTGTVGRYAQPHLCVFPPTPPTCFALLSRANTADIAFRRLWHVRPHAAIFSREDTDVTIRAIFASHKSSRFINSPAGSSFGGKSSFATWSLRCANCASSAGVSIKTASWRLCNNRVIIGETAPAGTR